MATPLSTVIILVMLSSSKSDNEFAPSVDCTPCICSYNKDVLVANCTSLNLDYIPSTVPNGTGQLHLSNNNFAVLRNNIFSRFKSLFLLDFSKNNLSKIEENVFVDIEKLQVVSLANNRLLYNRKVFVQGLFKPLKSLITLMLNNNHEQELGKGEYPDYVLKDLIRLEELHMDGLFNRTLGSGFSKMVKLTSLLFNGKCNIHQINEEMFVNTLSLTYVYLANCEITFIHPDSFSPLQKIQILNLTENQQLKFNGVKNAIIGLQNSSIKILYINKIVKSFEICVIITDDIIQSLQNTSLVEIQADQNRIEIFGAKTLSLFPKTLKRFSLKQNRLTWGAYIAIIRSLTGLEEIDLSGQPGNDDIPKITEIRKLTDASRQRHCYEDDACDLPIDHVWIPSVHMGIYPSLNELITFGMPPKLQNLTCTHAQLSFLILEVTVGENSLRKVNLSSNLLSTWTGPVYGLDRLEVLDLADNIARHVSLKFFQNFTGLRYLDLSHNFLGLAMNNDTNGDLFRSMKNLTYLDLSENFIHHLYPHTFKSLSSMQDINLSKNNIYGLNFSVSHMKDIRIFRCNSNQLRWIPKLLMNQLDQLAHLALQKNQTLYMDLSDNPISCTCDNLPFLLWLRESDVVFGNFSRYNCIFNNGYAVGLQNIDFIYESLHMSCYNYFGFSLGVVAAFVLTLSIIVSAVAYRYRWKLRYWYYAARYATADHLRHVLYQNINMMPLSHSLTKIETLL